MFAGAPVGKRVIIMIDDLNMPKLDTYGSQPPIELLRQYLDFGGLYDREKLFWKEIQVGHQMQEKQVVSMMILMMMMMMMTGMMMIVSL